MIDKKIEEIENYMDEFFSIPKKIPIPRSKAIKPLEESSSIKGNNNKTYQFIN